MASKLKRSLSVAANVRHPIECETQLERMPTPKAIGVALTQVFSSSCIRTLPLSPTAPVAVIPPAVPVVIGVIVTAIVINWSDTAGIGSSRKLRDRCSLRSPGNGLQNQRCERHRKQSSLHDSSPPAWDSLVPKHDGGSATMDEPRHERILRSPSSFNALLAPSRSCDQSLLGASDKALCRADARAAIEDFVLGPDLAGR